MDLQMAGRGVMCCRVDCTSTMVFDDDTMITVENDFVYRASDGQERRVSPGDDPASCGPALVISRLTTRRGTAFEDGRLELDDGSLVLVPGGERYESWSITRRDGRLVVSIPDGDLAVRSPVTTTPESPPEA